MPYCLYKLQFRGPVHFGADYAGIGVEKVQPVCRADTFFSALCHGLRALEGKDYLELWLEEFQANPAWRISDLLPYEGDDLYWPRPQLQFSHSPAPTPARMDSSSKKRWKSWDYIPLSLWDAYLQGIQSGQLPDGPRHPWTIELQTRASVSYGEQTTPYQVGMVRYREGAGLYCLVEDLTGSTGEFEAVLKWLGDEGIGGERSTGLGQFDFEQPGYDLSNSDTAAHRLLARALTVNGNGPVMSLTTFAPHPEALTEDVLKNSTYTLVPRRGWVSSPDAGTSVRRRSVYMFGAGAVLPHPVPGRMLDHVAPDNFGHRVWRYGLPIWVKAQP